MKQILVLDFGGSAVKYALIDENLNLSEKGKVASPRKSEEQFLGVIREFLDRFGDRIQGIAMSTPGQMDPETGIYRGVGQYPFLVGRSIFDVVGKCTDLPLSVENDANCAIYAEHAYGALKGERNGIMLVLGTGIGGGVLINNEIIRGEHSAAGEFSVLRVNGSKPEIENIWMFQGGAGGLCAIAQEALQTEEKLDGVTVFRYIEEGNAAAMAALEEYARRMAIQIYNIQAIFDVKKIVIGGGISAQKLLVEKIAEQVNAVFDMESGLNLPSVRPQIVQAEFCNDANLLGAYCVYQKKWGVTV